MINGKEMFVRSCALSVLVTFLMLSCAHQTVPTGGPEDKTPPAVVNSLPRNGAVNHPVNQSIQLNFSEWIDVASAQRSLTLFPPLVGGHRVRASGRRITIEPNRAFADSTTYHIGLTSGLKDLRGNPIAEPYYFVFSTGPALDQGTLQGCVIDPVKRKIQPKIALFRCDPQNIPDTLFLRTPSYLGQTDTLGNFKLNYLQEGTYGVIAFSDQNGDGRLQPGKEDAYASVQRTVEITKESGGFIEFYPSETDSSAMRIRSVLAPAPHFLIVDVGSAPNRKLMPDTGWAILPIDSGSVPRVNGIDPVLRSSRMIVRLGSDLKMTGYRLVYPLGRRIHSRGGATHDTLRFNGTAVKDTVPPKLTMQAFLSDADFRPRISIVANEPFRSLVSAWHAIDTVGDTVKLSLDTIFADTILLTPLGLLKPGMKYGIEIPVQQFADISGNRARESDTTRLAATFSTVQEQKMAVSLTGGASCLGADAQRRWRFTLLGRNEGVVSIDRNGAFRFDSLPAGKGTLSYFVDRNGDYQPTPGTLFPWQPPEPSVSLPDTIEARARWEITDIDVKACPTCPRK